MPVSWERFDFNQPFCESSRRAFLILASVQFGIRGKYQQPFQSRYHEIAFAEQRSVYNELMDDETEKQPEDEDKPDEETSRLMEEHDIDEDQAEKVQELIDEGLDEDDAVELADDVCAASP